MDRLEISIGKKFKCDFDELKAFSDLSGVSMSKIIGKLIAEYNEKLKGKPKIIIDEELWDFSKYSREELEEFDTLISKLNRKLIEELCRK